MVKDGTFFTVQSFMVNQLGLSGNDLMVYAIIYGFSQDGESVFRGSRQYLADWCNSTVRGIQKNLNKLMELGLIEQVYHSADNHEVHYKAIVPNKQGTDEQSSPSGVNKVHEGNEQSSLYSIVDNLEDNIGIVSTNVDTEISGEISSNDTETIYGGNGFNDTSSENKYIRTPQKILTTEKKPNLYDRCSDIIIVRYGDSKVADSLREYLPYRLRSTLHPIGFNSWVGLLNKLDKLGKTDEEKCKIVEQSIKMKWDTFAELKTWGRKSNDKSVFGETDAVHCGTPIQSFRTGLTF